MKKIYSFFFVCLLATSCNILDRESPNDVADDLVFNSEDGANAALIGLYNSLQSRDYYGGYYPLVADLYSDVGTAGGFDNVSLDEISILAVTPSNIITENIWLSMYQTIAIANAIIERVDDVEDAGFSQDEKDHIKGQAHAIRALAHFDVLRMFGEHWNTSSQYGIPVVTAVQKPSDIVERSSVQATYTAIISDLNAAAGLILADDRSVSFINPIAVKALLARVQLYAGNKSAAITSANEVISEGSFSISDADNFTSLYTSPYISDESLFQVTFDVQNRSAFNAATFSRPEALRTEVLFLADAGLADFFSKRPDDIRSSLYDFENNDESILPDGRTQKYRGEETRDNPAYVIRMAEVYLIRAEAKGLAGGGLDDLNTIRTNRGMSALANNFSSELDFKKVVLNERVAELSFEGTRMFDLARTGLTEDVLGIEPYKAIFPIPLREIIATGNRITQNPGYPE